MTFIWILPVLGAFVGGFTLFETLVKANSAPQQAAGAAFALCWAIIPYVLARALEGIVKDRWREKVLDELQDIAESVYPRRPPTATAPSTDHASNDSNVETR